MTRNPPTSPDLPCTLRFFLFILTFVLNTARRSNGTVNRPFLKVFDSKASPSNKRDVKTTDVMVDPSRNLWFRLFVPTTTTTTKLPVIIYFHGGGFVFFSANSTLFEGICRRLALKLPAIVISVNYRLAPEYRYPSAFEDGFDVLKFVDTENFEGFPSIADLGRCFLAGDSAGGNIAHHVAVMAGEHEFLKMKVIGIIGIQPFFGGEERTESETKLKNTLILSLEITDWYWKAFLPVGEDRDHPLVNVFGPRSDAVLGINFPASIVFVAGFDPLKDWQKRYCEGLKKAGKEVYMVEYPNAFHGFYCFPQLKEWSLLVEEVKDFIEKQSAAQ
ncbi:putative carboxylesterase [Rosa chinensis]|uniref:Putative carboxylesterase n=1 Tax=Rosa chinensis TaxID=74649 RepID=A0A2P6QFN2_ROSCH|nr:probable carboxylesterase 18 [Rosa chinensis]PRQ32996.1 putative carboxylesterase [Rosa chinensis]